MFTDDYTNDVSINEVSVSNKNDICFKKNILNNLTKQNYIKYKHIKNSNKNYKKYYDKKKYNNRNKVKINFFKNL